MRKHSVILSLLSFSTGALAQSGLPQGLRGVGIDQRLNAQAPLDLVFRDEAGRAVKLGDYFGRKPVLLAPVYYECPMLCSLVLNGLLRVMRAMALDAGQDYEVVTLSFDPREGPALAASKKETYLEKYGRPSGAQGWHFLTGDEESIRKLTGAIGFRYAWDEKSKQFAHASAIVVLTPGGRIARYYYGVEYPTRDVRLGLVEASAGRIGSMADQALLFCFHYDPATGKYGFVIMNVIRALCLATLAALVTLMVKMIRRERRREFA